jgi:hypothetical protein
MGIVYCRGRKAVLYYIIHVYNNINDTIVIVLIGPLKTLCDLFFYVPLLEVLFHYSSLTTT